MQALAIKYRPKTWDDVTEQSSTKLILQNQLQTGEIKNAYLFVGSAGTGKTTCARIFASEVNKGAGKPIELDAASNNGVDDVRGIIQQAQTKAIDSEYKVFIIDECHALSNNAWQAFLKLIEEPPAKTIFIFCTTDPQKIPKTIISRVQRFNFQRISTQGIVDRLTLVIQLEKLSDPTINAKLGALEYIAKLADGGMRDSLTLLDKCLAYSKDVTVENVIKALGTVNYETMMELTYSLLHSDVFSAVSIIDKMYADGKDLRTFTNQYTQFMIDVCKYMFGCDFEMISLPNTSEIKKWLEGLDNVDDCVALLNDLIKLKTDIKYSNTVRYDFEAMIICR